MIPQRFAAVILAAAAAHGCTVRPEQVIVGDFFAASRLRDLTALSRFATVVFEPRERGTVATFTIRAVSPERGEDGGPVKDVTIEAPVRAPDGTTVEKALVVSLQRRGGTNGGARPLYDGWVVVGVTEHQAAPPPPPR
jgi:hypothetical protein